MPEVVRRLALLLVVPLAACTTGPNAASSTAASIVGTARSATSSAVTPMKVAVSGTSLTTTTNSDGRFTLNDVPAGNVTLVFEATGVNARLPLGIVQAGDRVTITVTVNGTNATLNSRHDEQDDDDDDEDDEEDEDEVEGRVSGLGGQCPDLRFNVGTTAVRTSARTEFERVTCQTLANDMRIEAEGAFTNGVLDAKEIERK